MLVELLINFVYFVLNIVTAVFTVPTMPVKVGEVLGILVEYVSTGIAILGNYMDMAYILTLFTAIAVLDTAVVTYKIVMWFLRKIPVLNIN